MSGPQLEEDQSSALTTTNRAGRITHGVIAVAALAAMVVGGRHVLTAIPAIEAAELLDRHGPALIGIPGAAGVATILVGALRAIDGPLQFEFLGLKAGGAVAAAIAWVIAFLTVALSIRVLW